MIRIFFPFLLVLLNFGYTYSCTNFLVTKGASADGSTMITYAADSHTLFGELYFRPSASYSTGDSVDIYEWDTGHFLGKIKQTNHTYQVVGNINEHQLSIGETTYGGRLELQDSLAVIDYGSLIYITLQRARTAREAILTMDALTTEYGYFSEGESFSIADPNEVWIMEIIGKGKGNKGAVWVARLIPDGYISGHANQARITTFPLNEPENCLYSADVISLAREKGYFKGEDKDFSFADAYAPLDFGAARFCESRVWSGFRKVNSGMDKYEDYAMGLNLTNRMPLWVKPEHKLSLEDVFGLMRDYFQGTKMDMTKDIGAGPYECIVRWRPMQWELNGKTYFNERAISTQQTGFSFIAQMRSWLPDPIGGIFWFGVDDTYSTVYNPIYCGINRLPTSYAQGNGSMMEFKDDAAFWVFNQVSNLAYTRYDLMIPYIQKIQSELESKYIAETKKIDEKALELYSKKPKKSIEFLTAYSTETADSTVIKWKELYAFLFTRFLDGNVKTPVAGEMNPDLEQPGYSKEWYQNLIEKTGDKYLYLGSGSH
jgi:dipeptidase